MLFNSVPFVQFLFVALLLYWLLPPRARCAFLLVSSYFFYGSWDYRFLSLIAISTVVDFVAASRIGAASSERSRRSWLLVSVTTNLGILGFFKYYHFFVDSLRVLLDSLGLSIDTETLHVVLPVGISFYTLQTMSYTIDVYRRQTEPTRDFVTFATYVAFFPQLVAGPIERFFRLFPQLSFPASPDASMFRKGVFLLLQGYLKKIVIADGVAPVVDAVFAHPAAFDSGQLLEASILATVQLYCDFSGYSDIARGVAYLLGIELTVNFRAPLLSASITEFWRRWHVSLSQWLRDYLYIPLGGNRRGRARTYSNLLATMLIGGLWHGAAWKFVAWGGLHGVALCVERALGIARGAGTPRSSVWVRPLATSATFAFVVLAFVFFRADSIGTGLQILGGIVSADGLASVFTPRLVAAAVVIVALDIVVFRTDEQTWPLQLRLAPRVVLYTALAAAIVVLGGHHTQAFIYFAF